MTTPSPRRKRRVLVGILGFKQDRRDVGWGPTYWAVLELQIELCVLICSPEFSAAMADAAAVFAERFPGVELRFHVRPDWDRFNLAASFEALHGVAVELDLDPYENDLYVHLTTGTLQAQLSMFALAESRHFPGTLVLMEPSHAPKATIIDLNADDFRLLRTRHSVHVSSGERDRLGGAESLDPAYRQFVQDLAEALLSPFPILLLGEMGTGKSTLAEQAHALKHAQGLIKGRFIAVNCAQLDDSRAESALFGHAAGAYTGAVGDFPGALKEADGGVLLLDEVATLSRRLQQMLLTALQTHTWYPMGSRHPVRSRFQVISCTNEDVEVMSRRGEFRSDTLARIRSFTLRIPPLRERLVDFPAIFGRIFTQTTREAARTVRISPAVTEHLVGLATSREAVWEGNLRDVQDLARLLVIHADGGMATRAVVDRAWAEMLRRWRADEETLGKAPAPGLAGDTPDLLSFSQLRTLLGDEAVAQKDEAVAVELELTLFRLMQHGAYAPTERAMRPGVGDSAGTKLSRFLTPHGLTREVLTAAGYLWNSPPSRSPRT